LNNCSSHLPSPPAGSLGGTTEGAEVPSLWISCGDQQKMVDFMAVDQKEWMDTITIMVKIMMDN